MIKNNSKTKSSDITYLHLNRLFILILPLSYYFLNRKDTLLLNAAVLIIVLFIAYLKYYLKIKIKPGFLSKIFAPEAKFIFLTGACFLSIVLFNRIIAMSMLLSVILGNTLADITKERHGKVRELLVFSYICLSCSLFILFFPLFFDWHIALFGCLVGVIIRLLNFPVNNDISIAFGSGLVMTLFLI